MTTEIDIQIWLQAFPLGNVFYQSQISRQSYFANASQHTSTST